MSMFSVINPDVPVANLVNKDIKMAKKILKEAKRKAAKQKRNANNSPQINIPITYEPAKDLLYDAPINTVGYPIVQPIAKRYRRLPYQLVTGPS